MGTPLFDTNVTNVNRDAVNVSMGTLLFVNGDAPFWHYLCQKGAAPLTAQLTASNYAKNILATFKKNVEKATFKDILIVLKNAFLAIDKL